MVLAGGSTVFVVMYWYRQAVKTLLLKRAHSEQINRTDGRQKQAQIGRAHV